MKWLIINEIKIFTIWVEKCNSVNLYGFYVLRYESLLTLNFLYMQRIKELLVAIDIESIWYQPIPLSFFVNTPFKGILKLFIDYSEVKFNLIRNIMWLYNMYNKHTCRLYGRQTGAVQQINNFPSCEILVFSATIHTVNSGLF